uniref:RING-type domain-containing protein n=1 Tax=Chlamydomonas euryale TaxID=1486919 RepID=A0A7R9VBC0_9CHLO|mmetsp:Transcript_30604/g.90740  ORF Transcript_30604/g.90740 Transcript_30604/m.90740 type:complete len:992 (+) Transcript_30604:278-3253(+)
MGAKALAAAVAVAAWAVWAASATSSPSPDRTDELTAASLFAPASWGVISVAVWLTYVMVRGWDGLSAWDRQQFLWGTASAVAFLHYLRHDPEFRGWGDVYFFCGRRLQYCTCGFRWNALGWVKATVLWNFVLTAALGAQRLAIQVGLNGLLPGEEVVTKESFVSICWRLIPYWLNNWEQQWGAECSSMMFELPHFAVELLVILPCVQIISSRMKILAMPVVNMAEDGGAAGGDDGDNPGDRGEPPEFVREHYVPNILKGFWERRPEQRRMLPRLLANSQIMAFTVLITGLAALNALYVPLYLEQQIQHHRVTGPIQIAGRSVPWDDVRAGSAALSAPLLSAGGLTDAEAAVMMDRFGTYLAGRDAIALLGPADPWPWAWRMVAAPGGGAAAAPAAVAFPVWSANDDPTGFLSVCAAGSGAAELAQASTSPVLPGADEGSHGMHDDTATGAGYAAPPDVSMCPSRCGSLDALSRNTRKHADEIRKMQDPEHTALVPLVESALAVMRLSCEKYFVLLSVFVSYLLFSEPPPAARAMIRINARLSTIVQKVILYSFPAVCWVYGAGFVFSTFVSMVFWGGPLMQLYQALRSSASVVRIRELRPATATEIERMGGNCAICWGEMEEPNSDGDGSSGSEDGPETEQQPSNIAPIAAGVAEQERPLPELLHLTSNADDGEEDGGGDDEGDGRGDAPVASTDGFSLPCGHAYHHVCLHQWLHQCHAQGTTPTCPMCQAAIELQVMWQLPLLSRHGRADGLVLPPDGGVGAGGDGLEAAPLMINPNDAVNPEHLHLLGLLDHQRELQEMLRDMPQILPPEGFMALPEGPVQQLAAQRDALAAERAALLERRVELQRELERQQVELRQLHDQQVAVRRQEAELQAVEGQLRRQLQELHTQLPNGEHAAGAAHDAAGAAAGLEMGVRAARDAAAGRVAEPEVAPPLPLPLVPVAVQLPKGAARRAFIAKMHVIMGGKGLHWVWPKWGPPDGMFHGPKQKRQ